MVKWIIAVIVVVAGAIFLYAYNKSATPAVSPSPTETAMVSQSVSPSASPSSSAISNHVTVTYTDSGYSPKSVIIPVGGTVTFVNNSSRQMWTASDPHPLHNGYSGTSESQHCPDTANVAFDECKSATAGQSWSFTFTKAGTWGYHNHRREEDGGTVIVQ